MCESKLKKKKRNLSVLISVKSKLVIATAERREGKEGRVLMRV